LILFHDTCALCTALNSFAACEDFLESFAKHDTYVAKIAISHSFQPVPRTSLLPKYNINITPVSAITLYIGGNAVPHTFALTADFS
jgi:hypothetical protein